MQINGEVLCRRKGLTFSQNHQYNVFNIAKDGTVREAPLFLLIKKQ